MNDLAVITVHFNWAGFSRPLANLRRFLRLMPVYGVDVFGIELHLRGAPAQTCGIDGWRQVAVPPRAILWQKEYLLNILARSLPAQYTKIAWVDHDVFFSNKKWARDASAKLDEQKVIQLFEKCAWTNQEGGIFMRRKSCGAIGIGEGRFGHHGFAWAARRDFFDQVGLYPYAVMGSGDIVSACGMFGVPMQGAISTGIGLANKQNGIHQRWFEKCRKYMGSEVPGFIRGTAYHEWHGTLGDRKYMERHAPMKAFDATNDIVLFKDHIEWSHLAPKSLIAHARSYFLGRKEDGAESVRVVSEPAPPASLVLTSHGGYMDMLPSVMAAIDRQTHKFASRILVLDRVGSFAPVNGWTILHAQSGSPNPCRNLGLDSVATEWAILWDGDNIMPRNYHESMLLAAGRAPSKAAFIYPNIAYFTKAGEAKHKIAMPAYDYWLLRERPFVDTSSLWNVAAIRSAGGFSERQVRLDDYELALRLTRCGWSGFGSGVETHLTSHDQRRSKVNDLHRAMWTAHTFAFVTLWSDWADVDALGNWYRNCDLPPQCSFYFAVNASDQSVHLAVRALADDLPRATVIDLGQPWAGGHHRDHSRHLHVAGLYNRVLPQLAEDYVMLIEDDNLGPLDGVMSLLRCFKGGSKVAGAAGLYRSRSNPGSSCASSDTSRWRSIQYEQVPPEPIKAGMFGGGFTLYGNWALRKALPCRCTTAPALVGWDGNLGMEINALGYELMLHGGVRVDHLCREVQEFLAKREVAA